MKFDDKSTVEFRPWKSTVDRLRKRFRRSYSGASILAFLLTGEEEKDDK